MKEPQAHGIPMSMYQLLFLKEQSRISFIDMKSVLAENTITCIYMGGGT
jgi:hypothetical protein